ncbi:MAG: pyrimidine 5'-nucleotidase [Hyphomonadaceae bacterium]
MSISLPRALADRQTWVFDLDNTLYPASCNLFAQIDQRITRFVADLLDLSDEQARALQKQYYADHGTTLNGLMIHYDLDPAAFLAFVHDIDHSPLPVSARLRQAIARLPGRKFVLTNGSHGHAVGVTRAMKLDDLFDGMFGIEDMNYQPKPHGGAYDAFLSKFGVDPAGAVFFEDLARNLEPAHAMGFATVLVYSDKDWSHEPAAARPAGQAADRPPYIDHTTDDLTLFLESVFAAE